MHMSMYTYPRYASHLEARSGYEVSLCASRKRARDEWAKNIESKTAPLPWLARPLTFLGLAGLGNSRGGNGSAHLR